MIDFATRKDYARHLLEKISEGLAALGRLLESHGCGIDIIYMCDDYCSQAGALFSPSASWASSWRLPAAGREGPPARQKIPAARLRVGSALLPMIIDSGVDMLEPVQTARGDGPCGRRDFGKHLCFYGGVDLQRVLSNGSPKHVADEVKRLVDVLGRDGRLRLGTLYTYIQVDALLKTSSRCTRRPQADQAQALDVLLAQTGPLRPPQCRGPSHALFNSRSCALRAKQFRTLPRLIFAQVGGRCSGRVEESLVEAM